MNDEQLIARISSQPQVLAGKPTIRGTRLSVEFVLNQLAHGVTIPELLVEYEGLEEEDILACMLYASKSLDVSEAPLVAELS